MRSKFACAGQICLRAANNISSRHTIVYLPMICVVDKKSVNLEEGFKCVLLRLFQLVYRGKSCRTTLKSSICNWVSFKIKNKKFQSNSKLARRTVRVVHASCTHRAQMRAQSAQWVILARWREPSEEACRHSIDAAESWCHSVRMVSWSDWLNRWFLIFWYDLMTIGVKWMACADWFTGHSTCSLQSKQCAGFAVSKNKAKTCA